MPSLPPTILFEDTHLVVLAKPAGLLSQGDSSGEANLVDWLREYFGRHYVGLVHRLDRNTSGVMIVAKRSKSAERLTRALIDGDIARTYLGWVEGTLASPARWRHRLLKDHDRNQTRVVRDGETVAGAQEAILAATPLRRGSWRGRPLTLVEYVLETGRSHQIRIQSSAEGFPLLGDRKYSAGAGGHDFPRTALHSHRISFPHPMSGETLRFEAPIPEDLAAIDGASEKSNP